MKVHFKINILLIGALITIAVLSVAPTVLGQEEQNVTGWSWVGNSDDDVPPPPYLPHIGWISANCYNYYNPGGGLPGSVESKCSNSNYGVTIDPATGDMSGYMWNAVEDVPGNPGGMGWIDLDPDPFPAEPHHMAKAVPEGEAHEGQISGWARINSLKQQGESLGYDNWGWVHLGPAPGDDRPPNPSNTYGVYIDYDLEEPCKNWGNERWCFIKGYAWAGGDKVGEVDEADGLGWLYFGEYSNDHYRPVYNPDTGEVKGWVWQGNDTDVPEGYTNIGWISLNCENWRFDECDQSNYKVKIDPETGDFLDNSQEEGVGYAWMGSGGDTPGADDSIGWIDFNPNPFPSDPDYPAKVLLTQAHLDAETYRPFAEPEEYKLGDIVGWARVISLLDDDEVLEQNTHPDDWGWVKLHRTEDTPDDATYGLALSFGSEEELGQGGKIGGRCYKASCEYDGDTAEYGEFFRRGFAWSGGGSIYEQQDYSHDVGFGWMLFDSKMSGLGTTYIDPFFAVEGGSIYSRGNIGSEATFTPPAMSLEEPELGYWYNATYMIVSGEGTITHFCSAEGTESASACGTGSDFIQELANEGLDDPFSAPLYQNEYTNALGKIDIDGLIPSDTEPPYRNIENKYGSLVDAYEGDTSAESIENSPGYTWGEEGARLNGKIYYIQGDLTVNNDLTFNIGTEPDFINGTGTIIVDGDLSIEANTYYEQEGITLVDKIIKLPVVAWLVRGDVNILGSVEKTVGVYISVDDELGDGGIIRTGESNELLEVSGAMIAKRFEFQRTGFYDLEKPEEKFTNIQPAEKIINDGRAGANTPPGLQDFSLAFPVIRQAAPVEIE